MHPDEPRQIRDLVLWGMSLAEVACHYPYHITTLRSVLKRAADFQLPTPTRAPVAVTGPLRLRERRGKLCYIEAQQMRDLARRRYYCLSPDADAPVGRSFGWTQKDIAHTYRVSIRLVRHVLKGRYAGFPLDYNIPDDCRPLTLLEGMDALAQTLGASDDLTEARSVLEQYGRDLYDHDARAKYLYYGVSPEIPRLLNAAMTMTFTHIWRP